MNDVVLDKLIRQIRGGNVVPVLGPQLLVGPDGRESLQRKVAERLLAMHPCDVDPASLTPFRELAEAISHLNRLAKLDDADFTVEDLYVEVDALIQELTTAGEFVIPAPIRQLAEITDFRLFVTLTPDGLLARCLQQRKSQCCAVDEVIHSPKLPTSESRDLPAGWNKNADAGKVHLLYLFGKSRPAPFFAIHDEDVLEYTHNLMSRGSQVPTGFLGELVERNLLLIGCNFPDWLSRFFLRLTNNNRLSTKEKGEWVIEQHEPPEPSLSGFVRGYCKGTQIHSQLHPVEFVAALYQRWEASRPPPPSPVVRLTDELGDEPRDEQMPSQALFFISYSRATDQPRAEAIRQALLQLGLATDEVWFDRKAIEPGDDFGNQIIDGIHGCRYFLPLLSVAAMQRRRAFVFREWQLADDLRLEINGAFIVPVIVDAEYELGRYTADPVPKWARKIDFGHAPEGVPDESLLEKLKALVRDARRPRECLVGA